VCSPHSAADIQSHMEKYLVDAPPPPLRQSRPTDYRRESAAERDDNEDEDVDSRATPTMHVHDVASLHPTTGTLPDVKPLRSINSDGRHSHLHLLALLLTSAAPSRDGLWV